MQILTSTDHNIDGNEAFAAEVTDVVANALRHVSDHITRVEVHFADENGPKTDPRDIRCMLEARIEGRQPIAVTHHADTTSSAAVGAAGKLASMIAKTLDRAAALRRTEGV